MSTETEHPLDYLPELAFGVLPEVEAAPIRRHLGGCAQCRSEYDRMVEVAAVLPLAAVRIEPSTAVKAGLMQRIAHEPRPMPANLVRPRWWIAIAASAALLLASGAAVGLLIGRSQNDEAALRAQVQAVSAEAQRNTLLARAAAQGTLQASDARQGNAWASFVRAPGATWGYVWVSGLPQLSGGETYQAWFSRDGETYEPSAVFALNSGGVWLWANSAIDNYQELELTMERSGGASTPGNQVVLTVDLRAQ